MAGYGDFPALQRVWTAIPFVLLALGTAAGVGAWLAALNVKYRDVRFVVPFLLQLWLFVELGVHHVRSPDSREPWATLYWLNPMAGVVEGFRWAMLGGVRPELAHIALATRERLVVLASGLVYFKRHGARLCRHRLSLALSVRDLSKTYRLGERDVLHGSLRDAIVRGARSRAAPGARHSTARPRGARRARRRQLRRAARRGARHHRPQRRRQDARC